MACRLHILLLLAMAPLAMAEQPSEEEALDELLEEEFSLLEDAANVVESAARHQQELGMSPSAVTVITRKDIEASGAQRLVDILRLVPGLDVILATPAFSAVGIRSPWSHENNFVLVLIDGRETTVEFMGMPFLEMLPISLDDIERIEVIKGPGSALYGANAFAGVISIFTRGVADKTYGHAYFGGGEDGRIFAAGKFSARIEKLGFFVTAETDRANDFMDRNALGIESLRVRAMGEWHFSETERLVLDASLAQGGGPIPTTIGTFQGDLRLVTVRTAYESRAVKSHLYWTMMNAWPHFDIPLAYNRITLARLLDTSADGHVLDGEVQWQLPQFWEPLLLIAGAGARLAEVASDQFLDAGKFSDPNSNGYHLPGIVHYEERLASFLHLEVKPADWATVTGGVRVDYNSETGLFFSPRLAGVFRPWEGHFLRLGVGRSFRKPSFMETDLHPDVSFPEDSPLVGGDQILFREFMTRVVGTDGLKNEELLSFEAGYLAFFWRERLRLRLDLYYNMLSNEIFMVPEIVVGGNGLPDLHESRFQYANSRDRIDVFGGELELRVELSPSLSLSAWWAHREVVGRRGVAGENLAEQSPKNLLGLGVRYWSESGPFGSLYLFSRSDFTDNGVENPEGLMAPVLEQRLGAALMVMGKFGWRFELAGGWALESGLKIMQPISLSGGPGWCYREKGGVVDSAGKNYSGELLCRMVMFYLEGSI